MTTKTSSAMSSKAAPKSNKAPTKQSAKAIAPITATPITAAQVADFLLAHPQFLLEHPELLTELELIHQRTTGSKSLIEHQVRGLRQQRNQQSEQMRQLLQVGHDNQAIAEKFLQLANIFIASQQWQATWLEAKNYLHTALAIETVTLRLWGNKINHSAMTASTSRTNKSKSAEAAATSSEFSPVPAAICREVEQMSAPYLGLAHEQKIMGILSEKEQQRCRSIALINITSKNAKGFLLLGSAESDRFYPEMGSFYLQHLQQMLTKAIERLL